MGTLASRRDKRHIAISGLMQKVEAKETACENGAFKKGSQGLEYQVADVGVLRFAASSSSVSPSAPASSTCCAAAAIDSRVPSRPAATRLVLKRCRPARGCHDGRHSRLPSCCFCFWRIRRFPARLPPEAVALLVRLLPVPFVRSDGSEGVRLGD